MIKFFSLSAALAVAAIATPAFAAPVTGTVDITGSVAPRCKFTTANAEVVLGELANADGGLNAALVNGNLRTLKGWCNNAAATVSVKATAITGDQAVTTGAEASFTDTVNFTATAVANGQSFTDASTDDVAGLAQNVNMFSGDIEVTLSGADAAGKLLVAGDYTGKVEVILSPTV